MAEVEAITTRVCPACRQPYRPMRVIVGWAPCDCPAARETGGHVTVRCRACDHLHREGHAVT